MTLQELQQALAFSPEHRLAIDRRTSDDYPAYVRTVEIFEDLRVRVGWEPYGFDDGGVYLTARYGSLGEIVAALEEHLGTPLGVWRDLDAEGFYPPRPAASGDGVWQRLVADAQAGRIAVPAGASYRATGWLQ